MKKTAAALLSVGMIALSACGGGGSSAGGESSDGSLTGEQLTFVNWGGDGLKAAQDAWLDPFASTTGVRVATDSPSDQSKVKVMVDAGRTSWDVFQYAPAPHQCGVLYKKRPADFDISQVDPKLVIDDCGVPVIKQTVALVYNKKLFGSDPPTSMKDFLNTSKFPGKRLAFNYWAGSAEPLLMADGVAADDLYPIDWTRLEGVVGGLGNDLVFASTLDQQTQAVEQGDFALCLCYLGRTAVAADRGTDVGVVWTDVFDAFDTVYAVKGSKAPDAQWALMQELATADGQNGYYEKLPYGSTILGGKAPEVKAAWQPFVEALNTDKIKSTAIMDGKYWSENEAEAGDKWAALTSG